MDKTIRINKYISECGLCSRREADRLIRMGRVSVDGVWATCGMKISGNENILVGGKALSTLPKPKGLLLAFNKPRGIVCTTSRRDMATNIIDYINFPQRIYPIGRLDKDSEGLILLTNRGELVNKLNKPSGHHEKEYLVTCRYELTEEFLNRISAPLNISVPARNKINHSIPLPPPRNKTEHSVTLPTVRNKLNHSVTAPPAKNKTERSILVPAPGNKTERFVKISPTNIRKKDKYSFYITLHEGYNRQIRRMCETLKNPVISLRRVRIININLGELKEGRYRLITGQELKSFEQALGVKHT